MFGLSRFALISTGLHVAAFAALAAAKPAEVKKPTTTVVIEVKSKRSGGLKPADSPPQGLAVPVAPSAALSPRAPAHLEPIPVPAAQPKAAAAAVATDAAEFHDPHPGAGAITSDPLVVKRASAGGGQGGARAVASRSGSAADSATGVPAGVIGGGDYGSDTPSSGSAGGSGGGSGGGYGGGIGPGWVGPGGFTGAEKQVIQQGFADLFGGGGLPGFQGGSGRGSGNSAPPPPRPPDAPDAGPGCEKCGGEQCVDLSQDMKNCGACGRACGPSQRCVSSECFTPGGQYIVYNVSVPSAVDDLNSKEAWGMDLDGDGVIDNQFANFRDIIYKNTTVDIATNVRMMVETGQAVLLFNIPPENAPWEPWMLFSGVSKEVRFDGKDELVVDTQIRASVFPVMYNPQDLHYYMKAKAGDMPPELLLKVNPLPGLESIILRMPVHQMEFRLLSNGEELIGRMQGAVRRSELIDDFAGQLAKSLTAVGKKPELIENLESRKKALLLFNIIDGSTPPCTDKDGKKASQGDGILTPCELTNHNLFKDALLPDIRCYPPPSDRVLNCGPSSVEMPKDSLSFGLFFRAVRAKF